MKEEITAPTLQDAADGKHEYMDQWQDNIGGVQKKAEDKTKSKSRGRLFPSKVEAVEQQARYDKLYAHYYKHYQEQGHPDDKYVFRLFLRQSCVLFEGIVCGKSVSRRSRKSMSLWPSMHESVGHAWAGLAPSLARDSLILLARFRSL